MGVSFNGFYPHFTPPSADPFLGSGKDGRFPPWVCWGNHPTHFRKPPYIKGILTTPPKTTPLPGIKVFFRPFFSENSWLINNPLIKPLLVGVVRIFPPNIPVPLKAVTSSTNQPTNQATNPTNPLGISRTQLQRRSFRLRHLETRGPTGDRLGVEAKGELEIST